MAKISLSIPVKNEKGEVVALICHICNQERNFSDFLKSKRCFMDCIPGCKHCKRKMAVIPDNKKCSKCSEIKDKSLFIKSTTSRDGLSDKCRKCRNKYINSKDQYLKTVYRGIIKRCESHPNYVAKKIKNFLTLEELTFLYDRDGAKSMKIPTIDRIDNDSHYILDNCQFIEKSLNSKKDKFKPIIQMDMDGNFIREWPSLKEAYQTLGLTRGNVSYAALGKRNHAGGYKWKYKD